MRQVVPEEICVRSIKEKNEGNTICHLLGVGEGGAVANVVRTCSPTPLYIKAIKYV